MEHIRTIESPFCVRAFDDLKKLPGKRQHPSILILAGLGSQVDDLAGEIHVAPFQGLHLTQAPSGQVKEAYGISEVLWQIVAQRQKRAVIDKSLTYIVFVQARNIRHRRQSPILNGEAEHPLERRQFAIDARVCGSLLLAAPRVGLYAVGRDVDRQFDTEKPAQMP